MRARGQPSSVANSSPGRYDDIGAASGPTEHDTRSAAWMTSLTVEMGALLSVAGHPWTAEHRGLGSREGGGLARAPSSW